MLATAGSSTASRNGISRGLRLRASSDINCRGFVSPSVDPSAKTGNSAFGDLLFKITQLVARAPFESSVTSYRGDLMVIVLFGVVSGVTTAAVSGCVCAV